VTDLTVVFYTANRIPVRFQVAVMEELRRSLAIYGRVPVVAVSQWHPEVTHAVDATLRPDVLLWVKDVQPSIAQVYRNILQGCLAAETPYVAFCEDDTVYVPEHFAYRPADDTFAYNERRLVLTRELSADGKRREAFYYFRPRTQMAMGICRRELMIDTLSEKFAKYPQPPLDTTVAKKAGWGEPGRYEKNLGLTRRALERKAWTDRPNVTFNHGDSLMGRRRINPDDVRCTTVEPWGEANALWERIHG